MSRNNPTRRPPISFIVTAYNTSELQERARAFAVREVLIKPVHPQLIWRHIINAINELQGINLSYADNPEEDPGNSLKNANLDLSVETKVEKLEVEPLLWEIASEFQPFARVKNKLLVVGETGTTATVWGDVLQLNQAFRILIENSIKHTPEGGTITITVEQGTDKVLVKIKDTGCGIPSSVQSKIFNHNEKLPKSNQNDSKFYKTDLTFVKAIANQHGGDLIVESETGKGSCFTLNLPYKG
jgi:signal transduction histidine kinase